MGFPTGERYEGTEAQNAALEKQFLRKCEFMLKHKVPIWNGEFGPVYEPPTTPDAAAINQARYNLLGAQLKIYDKYDISWSIWLYKVSFPATLSGPKDRLAGLSQTLSQKPNTQAYPCQNAPPHFSLIRVD